MKTRLICAVLLLGVIAQGCKSGDSEARAAAKRYYDRLGTRCGSRYLTYAQDGSLLILSFSSSTGYKGGRIAEYGDGSVNVSANPISDADKLNGIEWQGLMFMKSKTLRQWTGQGWGQYVDVSNDQVNAIPIFKAKGAWYYRGMYGSNLTLDQVPSPPQIDCSSHSG